MRGQITIFIILGIVGLVLAGFVFFIIGGVQSEENTQQIKEAIRIDIDMFADGCLDGAIKTISKKTSWFILARI